MCKSSMPKDDCCRYIDEESTHIKTRGIMKIMFIALLLMSSSLIQSSAPGSNVITGISAACSERSHLSMAFAAINTERSGCCSHHGGVCGCSGSSQKCCDGSISPSCGCYDRSLSNLVSEL